jgi:hypothetical protein
MRTLFIVLTLFIMLTPFQAEEERKSLKLTNGLYLCQGRNLYAVV